MSKLTCFFPVAALLLLASCSSKINDGRLFKPTNIRAQHFSIDPAKDTTLIGLRGGIFRISKGSFAGNYPVNIEIREVYSPLEIVYAGLVTESNGRLLESGGMVYFNAFDSNNKQAKLLKPVDLSIPSNYINENMQLFKGDELVDGTINWVDPEPLDTSPGEDSSCLVRSKALFESKCRSCHGMFRDLTGPALAGVEDRKNDRHALASFIRNPGATMAIDRYFYCQKTRYGSVMSAFPDLTDQDIDCLLDYIKNETERRPDLKQSSIKSDSLWLASCIEAPCGVDTMYADTTAFFGVSRNITSLFEEATKNDTADALYKDPKLLEEEQRQGLIDKQFTAGRYNFTVNTLGWFNVDAFYEGMEGTEIVDLFVKTDFEEKESLLVHVFFPAKKLLTVGVYHKNDSLFHFEKYKGQIPLFLNDKAIVFATACIGEKIFYGINSFTVTKNQTIPLVIKESTAEELSSAFEKMNLDGIELDVITKKRIIIPKDCFGNDTSLNVIRIR
jgi:mono/diheme cytochrome c family protein